MRNPLLVLTWSAFALVGVLAGCPEDEESSGTTTAAGSGEAPTSGGTGSGDPGGSGGDASGTGGSDGDASGTGGSGGGASGTGGSGTGGSGGDASGTGGSGGEASGSGGAAAVSTDCTDFPVEIVFGPAVEFGTNGAHLCFDADGECRLTTNLLGQGEGFCALENILVIFSDSAAGHVVRLAGGWHFVEASAGTIDPQADFRLDAVPDDVEVTVRIGDRGGLGDYVAVFTFLGGVEFVMTSFGPAEA